MLPALRERREDIPALVTHFVKMFSRRTGMRVATFLLVVGQACRRAFQLDPEITLVFIEQNWMNSAFQDWRNQELKQFTKETGIRVKLLPAPEGAEPLEVCRSFLETGAKIPDVYGVEVIWPEVLAENLLDLKAFVPAQEIARRHSREVSHVYLSEVTHLIS
jgi:hypothetical protein